VKKFGAFTALDGVDLDVESGRLTALLGPSGGGKSTLLRIIGGLETPDSGTVHIDGVEATGVPAQRRNVGFVFQHYAAFKHLSVYRNVAFGLEVRKRPKAEIRERVHELLELVHLDRFADRLPSQLSGGQRQRMALARALAVQPRVLLLDEPFGALDAKVRKELRDWLRRLHDDVHVTTLFVTHDQEEALEVADQIVVINEGRIEQVGSPDELYDEPANEFVMGFLGPVTTLGAHLVRPHDVEIFVDPTAGALRGEVTRVQRVGFEVRASVRVDGSESWVQLTRGQAEALRLRVAGPVWLRAAPHATRLALRQSPRADLGEDGLRGAGAVEPGLAGTAPHEGGSGRVGAGAAAQVRGGDPG
jgi:sulfate transport system ATP-binding protein